MSEAEGGLRTRAVRPFRAARGVSVRSRVAPVYDCKTGKKVFFFFFSFGDL